MVVIVVIATLTGWPEEDRTRRLLFLLLRRRGLFVHEIAILLRQRVVLDLIGPN